MEEVFYERKGVLVKLTSTRGRKRVRGSAGSYKREKQLSEAIVEAVIEASSSDSGRSEVKNCELDTISVTLCTLDSIDEVEPEHHDEIEIGKHGVIVEKGRKDGWMLPTMPVERGWKTQEFLDRTCCKAGLDRRAWAEDDGVKIYAFEGQIFEEEEPSGNV
ncbi:MAG: TIGR00296 family protein, partial [Halobacteria archaeon]|nr:TIGR00296 family protein [Halobacteria archaeon]